LLDLEDAIDRVFLPNAKLIEIAPQHWHAFLSKSGDNTLRETIQNTAKVGGGVKAPKTLSNPEPEYSEAARKVGYQGTVVLWLIVQTDGQPDNIRVVKPLGLGLDDNAVESVRQWRFDPATRDGEPVAVQINVEITFRLY